MDSFINAASTGDQSLLCSPEATLASHLAVFAAEEARVDDKVCHLSW